MTVKPMRPGVYPINYGEIAVATLERLPNHEFVVEDEPTITHVVGGAYVDCGLFVPDRAPDTNVVCDEISKVHEVQSFTSFGITYLTRIEPPYCTCANYIYHGSVEGHDCKHITHLRSRI